ncbi:MAG: cytochrome c, partial [Myxococcota bacterium]
RVPSSVVFALLTALRLPLVGCGGGEERFESEETRAIREKVRADMKRERLERIGQRLSGLNENLANSPNAFALSAGTADAAEEEELLVAGISLETGESVYTANCSGCHGARGQGDGPLSAGLQPTPAKHADGVYMNALSNDHIYKVIAEGGAAVGKSSMMAPWGTSLSDDEINSLIVFIRTLAEPAYAGPVPGNS